MSARTSVCGLKSTENVTLLTGRHFPSMVEDTNRGNANARKCTVSLFPKNKMKIENTFTMKFAFKVRKTRKVYALHHVSKYKCSKMIFTTLITCISDMGIGRKVWLAA